MTVYRAQLNDGGGPFFRLDGSSRNDSNISWKDFILRDSAFVLYGADSLESLRKLIENYGKNIDDFDVITYHNPKILSYNKDNGHVIFEVDWVMINGEVVTWKVFRSYLE